MHYLLLLSLVLGMSIQAMHTNTSSLAPLPKETVSPPISVYALKQTDAHKKHITQCELLITKHTHLLCPLAQIIGLYLTPKMWKVSHTIKTAFPYPTPSRVTFYSEGMHISKVQFTTNNTLAILHNDKVWFVSKKDGRTFTHKDSLSEPYHLSNELPFGQFTAVPLYGTGKSCIATATSNNSADDDYAPQLYTWIVKFDEKQLFVKNAVRSEMDLKSLRLHTEEISSIALLNNSSSTAQIATGSGDAICLWNIDKYTGLCTFHTRLTGKTEMHMNLRYVDDHTIASGLKSGMEIWKTEKRPLKSNKIPIPNSGDIAVSPGLNGYYLSFAKQNAQVRSIKNKIQISLHTLFSTLWIPNNILVAAHFPERAISILTFSTEKDVLPTRQQLDIAYTVVRTMAYNVATDEIALQAESEGDSGVITILAPVHT